MHTELKQEFMLWRLVAWDKIATKTEVETWTLREIYKANAMLDLKFDIETENYGRNNT